MNALKNLQQVRIECGCGCREYLDKFDKKNRPRKFIHGHHAKASFTGLTLWKKFISKVDVDPKTGCWNWLGAKQRYGYGSLIHEGKTLKAHRLSYCKFIGEIPISNDSKHGTCICHKCDNPACVNPEHLFAGTQKDNIHDLLAKKGHHNQLDIKVREKIEAMLASREAVGIIAQKLNVHRTTVSRIKKML